MTDEKTNPRTFVPTIKIGDYDCELVVHGEGAPDSRARMTDLAKFLSKLSSEEWDALHELGAFSWQAESQRCIDEIMRTLLRALSSRAWDGESEFTLDDVQAIAEVVAPMLTAYRSHRISKLEKQNEKLGDIEQRLTLVEREAKQIEDQMRQVIDETREVLMTCHTDAAAIGMAGRAPLPTLARTVALKARDNPELDATDGAHPAWLRGSDHGSDMTCAKLARVATGDFTGKPAFASEKMNALANDILGLRGYKTTLSEILLDLRASTVLREKPNFIDSDVWEDLVGIHERLKSG